jgi:hypothetical protein
MRRHQNLISRPIGSPDLGRWLRQAGQWNARGNCLDLIADFDRTVAGNDYARWVRRARREKREKRPRQPSRALLAMRSRRT